jgi:hypothetical protein
MPVTNLDYADDIVAVSTSNAGLQCIATAIQDFCTQRGMLINVDKTEVVTFVRTPGGRKPRVSIGGRAVRVGKVAKYLGMRFGSPYGITAHRAAHSGLLHGAWARLNALMPNLRCRVGVVLFQHLYTACVQSSLCYGCKLRHVHPRYSRACKELVSTTYQRLYASFDMHHAVPRHILCDAMGVRWLEDHCLLSPTDLWHLCHIQPFEC